MVQSHLSPRQRRRYRADTTRHRPFPCRQIKKRLLPLQVKLTTKHRSAIVSTSRSQTTSMAPGPRMPSFWASITSVARVAASSRAGEKVEANPVSRVLYDVGCYCLDELFEDRPIARFWFLETIASYVSMLHLYESFGWWREPELRKVHNAQEYNELHHLLIMEALGGNARWRDRFLGSHVAIGYYWLFLLRRFLLYKSTQTESRVRGVFSASSSRRRRRFVRSNSSRASLRLFSREFFFSRSTFPAACTK